MTKSKASKRSGTGAALAEYRARKKAEQEGEAATTQAEADGALLLGEEEVKLEGDFASLFNALTTAQNEVNADAAVKTITTALGGLSDQALKVLLAQPAVQALVEKAAQKAGASLKPGELIKDEQGRVVGIVPWSEQNILDTFDMVTFTPSETIPVYWNGHCVQLYANDEITCPSIFKHIYDCHLQATRDQMASNIANAEEHFGPGHVTVGFGWGAREAK